MFRMVGSTEQSIAVPQAALRRGGGEALAFGGAAWPHLRAWLFLAERLPCTGDDASAGQTDAEIEVALRRFGSPAQVRQLLRREPRAMSDGAVPATAYAALVWWIDGLQASAQLVVAILQRMPALARDGWPLKDQLRLLTGVADQAGRRNAHLAFALTGNRAALLAAHRAVAAACPSTGERLQRIDAAIAVLHERVSRKEREIARHGLFGAHRKQERMAELHSLQMERAVALAQAGRLQQRLGALDALREEGAWLAPALDDAIAMLEQLRDAWTQFGSCMSELRAAAVPGDFAQQFDRIEAIVQWGALERAARRFAADTMSDFHLQSDRKWSITTP